MKRDTVPLRGLGALLAVYLCAPFAAGLTQIGGADWRGVDVGALGGALAVSAGCATAATALIALGGVPLGWLLARGRSRALAWLGFAVQLPLALPPLTSGVLLLFLFGPYTPLGRLTGGALTDSLAGVIAAQTFVAAPFAVIAARSAFAALDPALDDVGATLGHRALRRFFSIALPSAWPTLRAGLLLAWLRAFGEFGATVMVAYHPYSLPVYTYVTFGAAGLPAMLPLLLPTLAVAVAVSSFAMHAPRAAARLPVPRDDGDDLPLRPVAPEDAPPAVGAMNAADAGAREGALTLRLHKRLGDFSLDVEWSARTRRLAVVGASGAGKSLLLRLIAGLEHADRADAAAGAACVALDGRSLDGLPPEARGIAYVPQDYGLFPRMTVARQAAFAVDADPRTARYWLLHLGVADCAARLPAELSLGQRQRVALARALARPCRLLLLDEPFAALDTPRRRQLRRMMLQLQNEIDATTVIVTHDPEEARRLADEMLVLDDGKVLQAGAVDAVFGAPASPRVAELLGIDA